MKNIYNPKYVKYIKMVFNTTDKIKSTLHLFLLHFQTS